eukprot:TRINITY_DN877_c0_g1_i4.p1 TRINITY_DN877_c0_g1~~TRINITY_DN877_c0_g1_i4.p1  ORF type:complete len:393 (-),score=160.08 TRINITY_DN877_c0_g1_i4:297-1415(-)
MAPKASKRGSSGAVGRPSKMQKKESVAAKCKEIAEALEPSQKKGVPADVIALLGATLKHCLPAYKEDRHEFQSSMLDMVSKTLVDAEAALVTEVESAQATVSGGDDEKKKREIAVTEAAAALELSVEVHKQKLAAKGEKADAFKATFAPLKEALAKQKEGDAEALQLEKCMAALEAAVADLLRPLKEAGGPKRQLHALEKRLTALELEDSLLAALELPLSKKPEQRGSFDAVILEQLDLQIAGKKAALEAKLAEAAPAREERAASVKAAQDAHDAAKAASDAAEAESSTAKKEEAAAKAAAAAAKDSMASLTTELMEAAQLLDAAREQLQEFRSGPLSTFKELLEHTAPVPEAPLPEVEAPAEAAATEMSAQ